MRYLRLWFDFLQMSWMADLEYRMNITVRVFGEVVWYITQLSVFEVLYTHTQSINGWDVHAMRVFMGSLFLVDGLYMVLFQENMDAIFTLVRKGHLHLYLVKPVNSQFMVSMRKISPSYLLNLVLVTAYLSWAISKLPTPVNGLQLLSYALLVFSGLVLLYSIRFMFGTLSVLWQDAGNIHFVWHQLYRLATRPDPIYPRFLRYFVLTVFPVGFFASVPARTLVEGIDWRLTTGSVAMAIGFLCLSNRFWNRALRNYSSSSS